MQKNDHLCEASKALNDDTRNVWLEPAKPLASRRIPWVRSAIPCNVDQTAWLYVCRKFGLAKQQDTQSWQHAFSGQAGGSVTYSASEYVGMRQQAGQAGQACMLL